MFCNLLQGKLQKSGPDTKALPPPPRAKWLHFLWEVIVKSWIKIKFSSVSMFQETKQAICLHNYLSPRTLRPVFDPAIKIKSKRNILNLCEVISTYTIKQSTLNVW